MALFNILHWTQKNKNFMRLLDYILAIACIAYGWWADSTISLVIGIIALVMAIGNFGQKLNLFLPRIVRHNPKDHD